MCLHLKLEFKSCNLIVWAVAVLFWQWSNDLNTLVWSEWITNSNWNIVIFERRIFRIIKIRQCVFPPDWLLWYLLVPYLNHAAAARVKTKSSHADGWHHTKNYRQSTIKIRRKYLSEFYHYFPSDTQLRLQLCGDMPYNSRIILLEII